ncbi:MAG: hypothetical protein U9R37_07390, partial [Campylobacterota bacterium]|nr:hypothetical protein [Campylobacterota bacterium]
KPFKSAIWKNKLSHFDKTDPKNIKLPEFLENINDIILGSLVYRVISKYKNNNYKNKDREELEELKDWSDLHILVLIKFYKNNYNYFIEDENIFFPHFVFTYNIQPLKKEIDKIVSNIYDKLESDITKEQLSKKFTYSALEVTYLLHYFSMNHPLYTEDI